MQNLPVRLISKSSTQEVNVARVLQAPNFQQCPAELEQIQTITQEEKQIGPKKIKTMISSRRSKREAPIPEYLLRADTKNRRKTWKGRSEASGRYAIMILEKQEAKLVLVDHWYKFTPQLGNADVEPETEFELGKRKREEQDKQLFKDVFGEDSEEETRPKKVPAVRVQKDTKREDLDYNEQVDDDEADWEEEEEEEKQEEPVMQQPLSSSGKELQKMLAKSSYKEEESGSSMGLSEEESEAEEVTMHSVVNELMRMGKPKLSEFISECRKKFRVEDNWRKRLTDILREVAEIERQGDTEYIVLKEYYKRSMPTHGARIHFHN
mgnify:FL=1